MQALLTLARHDHTRECLLLVEAIIETPGLMPRLIDVLRPKNREQGTATPASKDRSPGAPAGIREQRSGNRDQRPKTRGRKVEA
jgi:hypothetical protein